MRVGDNLVVKGYNVQKFSEYNKQFDALTDVVVNIMESAECDLSQFSELLLAATKLWPRLCFYLCVGFCSRGSLPQCMLGYHHPHSIFLNLSQNEKTSG